MGKSKAKSTVKKEDKVAPRLQVTRTDTGKTGTAIPLVPKTALGHAIITFKTAVEDRVNTPSDNSKDLVKLFDAAYVDGKDGCVSLMRFHNPHNQHALIGILEFIYHVNDEALTLHVLRKVKMGTTTAVQLISNFPNAHCSLQAMLKYFKEDSPQNIPVERRIYSIISVLLAETIKSEVDIAEPLKIMMNLGVLPHVSDAKLSNDKRALEHLAQYAHMVLPPEFAKQVMETTGVNEKASEDREADIVLSLLDRPQYKHRNVINNLIGNVDLTKYIESKKPEISLMMGDFIVKIIANFPHVITTKLFAKYPALYLHPIRMKASDEHYTTVLPIIQSIVVNSETEKEKAPGLICFKRLIETLTSCENESFIRKVLNDKGRGNEPGPLIFAAQTNLFDFIPSYFETGLIEREVAILAYFTALKYDSPESAKVIRSSYKKQHNKALFTCLDNESITRAAVLSSLSSNKEILGNTIAILDYIKAEPTDDENDDVNEAYANAFKSIVTSLAVQAAKEQNQADYLENHFKALLTQSRTNPKAYEMLFMAMITIARELIRDDEYDAVCKQIINILLKQTPNIRRRTNFSARAAHCLSMLYFETKGNPHYQNEASKLFDYLYEMCPPDGIIQLITTLSSADQQKFNQPDQNGIHQFAARDDYLKLAVDLILAEHERPDDSLLAQAGLLALEDTPPPPYRHVYLENNDNFLFMLSECQLFEEIMRLHRAGVLPENAMPTLYVWMKPENANVFFTQDLLDEMLQNPVQDRRVFNAFTDKLVAPINPNPDSRIVTTVCILLYLIERPKYINSLVRAIELYKPKFQGSEKMAEFLEVAAQVPNIQFIRRYAHEFTQDGIIKAIHAALAKKQWEAAAGLLQLVTPEEATFDELLSTVAQSRQAGLITAFVEAIEGSHNYLSLVSTYEAIKEIDSQLGSLKNKQPEYAKPLRQLRNACADHFLQHVVDDFYPTEVGGDSWQIRLASTLELMKKYPACQDIIAKKLKSVHQITNSSDDLSRMQECLRRDIGQIALSTEEKKLLDLLDRSTSVVRFSGASHSAGAKPVENNGPSTSASRPSQPPSSQMQRRRRK